MWLHGVHKLRSGGFGSRLFSELAIDGRQQSLMGTGHGLPYCLHEATGRFAFVGQGEMEECSSEDGRSKREGKGSYHVLRPSASAFVQIDTEEVLELERVGETMRVFKPCISERVAILTRTSRVESVLGCRLCDVKVRGHCVNRRGFEHPPMSASVLHPMGTQ